MFQPLLWNCQHMYFHILDHFCNQWCTALNQCFSPFYTPPDYLCFVVKDFRRKDKLDSNNQHIHWDNLCYKDNRKIYIYCILFQSKHTVSTFGFISDTVPQTTVVIGHTSSKTFSNSRLTSIFTFLIKIRFAEYQFWKLFWVLFFSIYLLYGIISVWLYSRTGHWKYQVTVDQTK